MATSNRVGKEVAALSNLIKRHVPAAIGNSSESELTSMQAWFINFIRDHDSPEGIFQRDLEAEFNITRATASSILKRMERDDLIVREQVDYDARLKKLILTQKSIDMTDKVHRGLDKLEDIMMQGISDDDLRIFFEVIEMIKANLQ